LKKVFLVFFITTFVFATEQSELFNNIFPELLHKNRIRVLTKLKLDPKYFIIVNSCKKAELVIGDFKCNKPTFVLDYYEFKDNKNAIGAFYWRKGRPQLRFRKSNIDKYHLYISKDFEDYLE